MHRRVGIALVVAAALASTLAGCSRDDVSGRTTRALVCDVQRPGGDATGEAAISNELVESYEIDVALAADGSATFTERITYRFVGAKRGIYREIVVRQACTDELDRVYPLEVLSVTSATAPAQFRIDQPSPSGLSFSDSVNVLVNGSPIRRIRIGDPDRTITGTHTYEIVYRLEGVLNAFEDHDEFYWNVVGNGWGVPINNVAVGVTAPAALDEVGCWAGVTGSRTACTSAQAVADRGLYTQSLLGPRQQLTVLAAFPNDATDTPAAIVDDRWTLREALLPDLWVVLAAFALTVAVIIGWMLLAWKVGRDRQVAGLPVDVAFAPVGSDGRPVPLFAPDHAPVEFVPPFDIRPGQAGVIVDEVAHLVDVTSTLVDLAVRGHLKISEEGRDFTLTRLEHDTDDLLAYEALLLDRLLHTAGMTRRLSDVTDTFAAHFREVVDALYDDVVERGWFHERPDRVRVRWRAHGIGLTVLAIAGFVGAALFTRWALFTVPVLVAGLAMSFGARFMPRRTPAGRAAALRLRGFEEFIRDSEAPRARWAEHRSIFSDYLPYAIVFGCTYRWATTFEGLAQDPATDTSWYSGVHTPTALASSMSSFTSSASTSLSSSPSSSGSGGGGGGSSGGGGGGGGGGSW